MKMEEREELFTGWIAECAFRGLILEADTHPSPGLVSPSSRGSHSDMHYEMMIRSALAIEPFFVKFAKIGLESRNADATKVLAFLRKTGIKAERAMFSETNGVNTHKGAIFVQALICTSAGRTRSQPVGPEKVCRTISRMTRGIVRNELEKNRESPRTFGELAYAKYGITGIRGEVERGLPTCLNHGLPGLREGLAAGLDLNDALAHALMHVMSAAEDTNIVKRGGGIQALYCVQERARNALRLGGMTTREGRRKIRLMDSELKKKNLSPGGCADLLGATATLYLLSSSDSV